MKPATLPAAPPARCKLRTGVAFDVAAAHVEEPRDLVKPVDQQRRRASVCGGREGRQAAVEAGWAP